MSNEEFQRQMEFILRQQVKFEANFEKQQGRDIEVNTRLDRHISGHQ